MNGSELDVRAGSLLAGPRGRDVCASVGVLLERGLEWPFDATDSRSGAAFIERLGSVEVDALAAMEDPLALLEPLAGAVDSARYWQEPDEEDALLTGARALSVLEPIARALASAPAAAWWWTPLDPGAQQIVRWLDDGRERAHGPELTGTVERLGHWRRNTVAGEREAQSWPTTYDTGCSGAWWSTPVLHNITTTSRSLGRLPAVQLELVEDSMGWDGARVAPAEVLPDQRVFEISAPSDWTRLVDRYPLDVDRSRRHDWWLATGGRGPWQIPDWLAVSRDYDAVHLGVVGYLAGAGRALPTRDGQTVLAGFDPDLTYWLTDTLGQAAAPSTWRRAQLDDDDHAWVRVTDSAGNQRRSSTTVGRTSS